MTLKMLIAFTALLSSTCLVVQAEDPGSIEGFPSDVNWSYDANLDGFVYFDDAEYILANVGVYGPVPWGVDVNQDGIVAPLDALLVVNALGRKPWQNNTADYTDRYDVNNSNGVGKVTPLDALLILNAISARGSETPPLLFSQADADQAPYYDVDGDNELTSSDALAVLNYLSTL
jgi:hypothetical protein